MKMLENLIKLTTKHIIRYITLKMGNIQDVFDCSVPYGGTSFNHVLMQGSDLTKNLVGVLCRFRKEAVAMMLSPCFINFMQTKKTGISLNSTDIERSFKLTTPHLVKYKSEPAFLENKNFSRVCPTWESPGSKSVRHLGMEETLIEF